MFDIKKYRDKFIIIYVENKIYNIFANNVILYNIVNTV